MVKQLYYINIYKSIDRMKFKMQRCKVQNCGQMVIQVILTHKAPYKTNDAGAHELCEKSKIFCVINYDFWFDCWLKKLPKL